MREAKKYIDVLSHMPAQGVCRWQDLKRHSKSPGRDVARLLKLGLLRKVGPGLYCRPQKSRFGETLLDDKTLVTSFLKSDDFLIFSMNLYNTLGLGLTQLRNAVMVYNKKRHEDVVLSGRTFYFRRPNNAYPDKLTKEFLLVDLMNNSKLLGEDLETLFSRVASKVEHGNFDRKQLLRLSRLYGKISTRKFFEKYAKEDK